MKKKLFVVCFLVGINILKAQAQVDCGNVGFEAGSTQGWTLTNGTIALNAQFRVVFQNEALGTFDTGHLIIKLGDGNDPRITAESLPMVAPGSNYSIRIGNSSAQRGSRFDRIKTSFVVTPENTLFQYKFAVVLQKDTRHESYQKPGFDLLIYDETKTPIPCSYYNIQLSKTGTAVGFKSQGADIEYRNWTTGAIDLREYVGRTLTVVVTAHGCTERGHYGYAYFDAQCLKSEIKPASVCPDTDGFLTLIAPEGFEKYKWNTGETTAKVKIKPKIGDKYFVKLVPYSSLDETCELQLDYQIKPQKADTTIKQTICEGEKVVVGNKTYTTTGTYVTKIDRGESCDSTVTLQLTVQPLTRYAQKITICEGESLTVGTTKYTTSGIYTTTIPRPSRCDSIVTTTLTVDKLEVSVVPNEAVISEKDTVQLRALVIAPTNNYTYLWTPDRGLSCTNCAVIWAYPDASTRYTLTVTNADKTCQKKTEVKITVNRCGIYVPDVFSPNNDQQNDVFFVQANECIKQIKTMAVYNRWGEVVFQQANFPPSRAEYGWNGTYLNQLLGPGVFSYKITAEFTDPDLAPHTYSGVLMLMK